MVEGRSDFGYNGPDINKKYTTTIKKVAPQAVDPTTPIFFPSYAKDLAKPSQEKEMNLTMTPIRQALMKLGLPENDWRIDFCNTLKDKLDVTKRVGKPFYQVWNGGSQNLNRYQAQLQAVQSPKNKPLMDFIRGIIGGGVGESVEQDVAEGTGLSVEQLAHISDKALDDAYHYGRSTPGANFGWLANMQSAKAAKRLIDAGVTDIEAISDAIHKGWNVTAAADYKGQLQLDTPTPDEKKLKRAKLAMQSYSQLPEDEKEKDRVVARALLQAIKGDSLTEFAPSGSDDREPDEEEILRQLAAQWWNGTEQQMKKAQQTLQAMGWEIGQDESGDDDAGVFVIRIGDENGDSYIAFNHSDLDLNEDYLNEK